MYVITERWKVVFDVNISLRHMWSYAEVHLVASALHWGIAATALVAATFGRRWRRRPSISSAAAPRMRQHAPPTKLFYTQYRLFLRKTFLFISSFEMISKFRLITFASPVYMFVMMGRQCVWWQCRWHFNWLFDLDSDKLYTYVHTNY